MGKYHRLHGSLLKCSLCFLSAAFYTGCDIVCTKKSVETLVQLNLGVKKPYFQHKVAEDRAFKLMLFRLVNKTCDKL